MTDIPAREKGRPEAAMVANGIGRDHDGPAASALSPDFLGVSTEAGLDKIRTRLLDLTNRNRLLNFRHNVSSSLRIVDTNLGTAFRLLRDAERLVFAPVPEPNPLPNPKPQAVDHASLLGWNSSYDLDHMNVESGSDLPVLHYVDGLETLTRKIGSAAKTAIEESGTNMLHMIFGFLEWYESDDSQLPRLAPLIAVPVALERSGGKGKGFECSVEYSGEDFTSNISLVEKMRRDFGIDIPVFEEEETPDLYFSRFESVLRQKPRWRIRRQFTLSLLSFGKLLMYRDLDPKTWPGIATHPLVNELFQGRKSNTVTHAPEYAIDDPQIQQAVPDLILDADSSQHSALIDALQGRNLVIEGPPGTGKSQTITNLIAAGLTRGKTVLFVSEKLAALEVVRRRLDDAGLGLFCLELHSHKTKKNALLKDLEARLRAQGSFRDPRDLDQHRAAVEACKRQLTEYAGLVNREVPPFGATIFEMLWARDRYYRELPSAPKCVEELRLPEVLAFDRERFQDTLNFLTLYEEHLGCVQREAGGGWHPWAWIMRSLNFEEEVQLVDLMSQANTELQSAVEVRMTLEVGAGLVLKDSVRGMQSSQAIASRLPFIPALNARLLASCGNPEFRALLRAFVNDVDTVRAMETRMRGWLTDHTRAPLLEDHAGRLMQAFDILTIHKLQQKSGSELRELLTRVRYAQEVVHEAARSFEVLENLVASKLTFSLWTVDCVLKSLSLLERAPVEKLHLRVAAMDREEFRFLLRDGASQCADLRQRHETLELVFDLGLAREITDPARLKKQAETIEEAGWLDVWFGGPYKRAVNTYRRISRHPAKARREAMARSLRSVADHLHRLVQFDANHASRQALGIHFRGVETAWADVICVTDWYEEVVVCLPTEGNHLSDLLLKGRAERLKSIQSQIADVGVHRDCLSKLRGSVSDILEALHLPALANTPLGEVALRLQSVAVDIEGALGRVTAADLRTDLSLATIPELLNLIQDHMAYLARISNNTAVRTALGVSYAGTDVDVALMRGTLEFAESLATSGLPEGVIERLFAEQGRERLEVLKAHLESAQALGDSLSGCLSKVVALTDCSPPDDESLQCLLMRIEDGLKRRECLPQWSHYKRVQAEAQERGVSGLTALADGGTINAAHLTATFRFLFFNTLVRNAFSRYPALSAFSGVTQDHARKQFALSDQKAIELFRERAAAITDRRPVPSGNQSGPVGTWTDLALITKEINKQKKHLPIRQLVRRASRALQALKPCFMMGPLSVAQYLTPGQIEFDLIVMDEASQLKPEDAIGAIARGGQIVIVGDPKQLPPTSFFQRVTGDEEDEDDPDKMSLVEEGESILDVASTLYQPMRRLRWHYRSRHHSLIAFSNSEFYQDDLVIFPSAYHEDSRLGVKYRPVPKGTFESSRNPHEAAVVVEAVLTHMREHPEESLGVVTLNFEQRELLEELLDQRLRSDPFAAAFQERMNSGAEPFFVKNLENVQGDERDVIFISVTYGPDGRGNQYMRFGPLNGTNGHRRLNVLFTRAKRRIEVFSSLDPDRIQVTPSSPWGLRALKAYLSFARSGILASPEESGGPAGSDFEKSVGGMLKERGYDVVPQVGVAGFFIDLAVRHPTKPGAFLLGIECDGATYHSARSARDRDRLRQEILENLGWKIYRIWSTDWFKSRTSEIERLIRRIEDLLAGDADYIRARSKVQRIDTLRERLTDLRDNDIMRLFPESDPDKCLLRAELLEEILRRRPQTRDDWFRLIPEGLRSGTDSRQVGQFLPQILETIAVTFTSAPTE